MDVNEFVVKHRPCLVLNVSVVRGRNITKGWEDYVDRPDPYVELLMRRTPDGKRRTKTVNNEANPTWNQVFTYYLDPENKNILFVTLKDDNYSYDSVMGKKSFNIEEMKMNEWTKKTLVFNKGCEVDIEMRKEYDAEPNLRYSLELCEEENDFRKSRREKTLEGMKTFLGDKAPKSVDQVPTVAVIGSGGGFRAMVGYSGVAKALKETGVLDCVTYMGGLSGSAWFVSTLFSHPKWPNISMSEFLDEMKNNVDSSLAWILTPTRVAGYLSALMEKRNNGQPISFTDFFGHLVGETLIKDRLDCKLSDQRGKIYGGNSPMPLYTCVHVKKDVSAKSFQEWVEFSPYEIGMPKYGSFMKSHYFGSKFYLGQLARKFDEPPLHFLQGIWGSAFCIMFDRLFEDNKNMDPAEMIRHEIHKKIDEEDCLSDGSEDEDDDDDDMTDGKNGDGNGDKNDDKEAPPKAKSRKTSENGHAEDENGEKKKSFWSSMFESMVESKQYQLLSTRTGRAGVVHNFLRGIVLDNLGHRDDAPDGSSGPKEKFHDTCNTYSTHIKKQFVVDGGLTFNSPYPLVVRRQRQVDVILSFDFSGRPTDDTPPFKELLLAEIWCRKNGHPFPPIDVSMCDNCNQKELYIFRHPTDPNCPIVLHFALVNLDFKKFKAPGVLRETQEEKDFADFAIFDDPDAPYSTFNFTYTHEAFDRLSKLMEFNTLKHIDDIRKTFADAVARKKFQT